MVILSHVDSSQCVARLARCIDNLQYIPMFIALDRAGRLPALGLRSGLRTHISYGTP